MSPTQTTPRIMLETLVGMDTTSRNSNLELIHYVRDYLDGHGVSSTLLHDDSGAKANLYATLGPERDGGVVLSGHTDVVPVDGQDWSSEPFSVVERDGRLYGRGTSDMKSFIATALALVPDFLAADLQFPIHLALSYDEEVGCLGVHGIVRHMCGLATRPRAVIIGEPTDMRVVDAHKSVVSVNGRVSGLEAHSSATQIGVNAIHFAAAMVAKVAEIAEEMRTQGPFNERFEPPYTTLGVGRIQGGTARNIIPREATFHCDIRAIPGVSEDEIVARLNAYAAAELLPGMRAVHDEAQIEVRIINRVPALAPDEGSDAETLVLSLVGSNQTYAVSYGTEGGIFQAGGIPTVVCGPGNIEQAHKPDEFIELSQIEACTALMHKLSAHLAEPG